VCVWLLFLGVGISVIYMINSLFPGLCAACYDLFYQCPFLYSIKVLRVIFQCGLRSTCDL
jgi:hypothetical protein